MKPIIPIFYIHWRIVQVALTIVLTHQQHISLAFGSMWDLLFPYSDFQMWNLHHSVHRIIKEVYIPIYTYVYIYIYILVMLCRCVYCIWLARGCAETLWPSGYSWHGAKLFMGCSRNLQHNAMLQRHPYFFMPINHWKPCRYNELV